MSGFDRRGSGRCRVLVGWSVEWRGSEGEIVDGELLDLIEAGAGEIGGGVAGVEFECVETGGFGVSFGRDGIGFVVAELLDGEVEGAGIDGFEGYGDVDGSGFIGGFPLVLRSVLPAAVSTEIGVDAGGAGGAEDEVVFRPAIRTSSVG